MPTNQLITRARLLRKQLTDAEKKLWQRLCRRQLGCRFRRQVPIEFYIADFICFEPRVVIEVDGGQHAERVHYDLQRTEWFEMRGYQVLRFWNHEVLNQIEDVMGEIWRHCVSPHPDLPPAGEGTFNK